MVNNMKHITILDHMLTNLELKNFLKALALQVKFGVPKEAIGLAKLHVPNLGRVYIQRLVQNDLAQAEKIRQTDIEFLKKILPEKIALELKQVVAEKSSTSSTPIQEVDFFAEVKLEIDGRVIENNGAGSYRLNLKKEEVRVNKENLVRMGEEEIKRLVGKL